MDKQTFNLFIKINKKLSEKYNKVISFDRNQFLKELDKQTKIQCANKTLIFGDYEYNPYFTSKERDVIVYMVDNSILDKFIFIKSRPKKQYKILKHGDVFQLLIRDKYKTGCSSDSFFIVE